MRLATAAIGAGAALVFTGFSLQLAIHGHLLTAEWTPTLASFYAGVALLLVGAALTRRAGSPWSAGGGYAAIVVGLGLVLLEAVVPTFGYFTLAAQLWRRPVRS